MLTIINVHKLDKMMKSIGKARLSLRDGGEDFPSYFKMNVAPGYLHRRIEENYNQKKSPAVWFPAYLLYLPGNLTSWWQPWQSIKTVQVITQPKCDSQCQPVPKAGVQNRCKLSVILAWLSQYTKCKQSLACYITCSINIQATIPQQSAG